MLFRSAEAGAVAGPASVALLTMLAESGAAAGPASLAVLAVLEEVGAAAGPASPTVLAMLAEAGAAAVPAIVALLAVLAESGTTAIPALVAPLAMRARISIASQCLGGGRCGRNCWGCLRRGAKMAAKCCKYGWVPFEKSRGLKASLDAPPAPPPRPVGCRVLSRGVQGGTL